MVCFIDSILHIFIKKKICRFRVKPVNKDYPREAQHLIFIDKWSLFWGFIVLF